MLKPNRSFTDVNFEGYKLFPQYPAKKHVVSLPSKTTGRYLEESTRTTFKQASTHFHFNQFFPHKENGKNNKYTFYYFDHDLSVIRITTTPSSISGESPTITPQRLFRIPSEPQPEHHADKQEEEPSLCALSSSLTSNWADLLVISDGEGRVYLYQEHEDDEHSNDGPFRVESILEGGCLCLDDLEENVEGIYGVTILDACWVPLSSSSTQTPVSSNQNHLLCVAIEHVTVQYPTTPQQRENISSEEVSKQRMDAAMRAPQFVSESEASISNTNTNTNTNTISEEQQHNEMQSESAQTSESFRHRSKPITVFNLSILTFSPIPSKDAHHTLAKFRCSGFFPNVMTSRSHFEAFSLQHELVSHSSESNASKDKIISLELITSDPKLKVSPDYTADNDGGGRTPMRTEESNASLSEMMDTESDAQLGYENSEAESEEERGKRGEINTSEDEREENMLPYSWEQDDWEVRIGVDLQPMFRDVFTAMYHLLDNFTVKITPHMIVIEEPGDGNRKYFEKELYSKINAKNSYWTVENGNQCVIYLEKITPERWPSPFSTSGRGPLQSEPGEIIESRTSEQSSVEQEDWTIRGPTLMTEELEDTEEADMEDTTADYYAYQIDMKISSYEEKEDILTFGKLNRNSLGSSQYLCDCQSGDNVLVCLRNGIDAFVFSGRSLWNATETVGAFNALGYVLDGKRNKKFVAITPDLMHAAIVEYNGMAFVYDAQVGPDHNARHNVVQLTDQDVVGIGTFPGCILVLCRKSLVIIQTN